MHIATYISYYMYFVFGNVGKRRFLSLVSKSLTSKSPLAERWLTASSGMAWSSYSGTVTDTLT